MLLQVASDLHLERQPRCKAMDCLVDHTDADVLVLAGDVHRLDKVVEHFGQWPTPVIYVHGNHELYYRDYFSAIASAKNQFAQSNIRFLEGEQFVLDRVRFLGCCLWRSRGIFGTSQIWANVFCSIGERDNHNRTALRTLYDRRLQSNC